MLVSFCDTLLELSAGLGTLLGSPVLHPQPSYLEVEGILTRKNWRFLNRSCHNRVVVYVSRGKITTFSLIYKTERVFLLQLVYYVNLHGFFVW